MQLIHAGQKLFTCTICEKKFALKIFLERHLTKVHGVTYEMKKSPRKSLLNRPIVLKGKKICETVQTKKRRKQILTPRTDDQLSNAYGCPSCSATFASIFDLKNHINALHESKIYNAQIEIPTVHEKKNPLNEVLNETEVHEGKKYLKCHFDNCDYTAVQTWKSCKMIMLQHIRAVHGGEKEDLTCHYINCDYTSKGQLISELLFGVFKFPKNQRKNFINFCPRI